MNSERGIKEKYLELYWDQIFSNKNKKSMVKEVVFTAHSMDSFTKRFQPLWWTIDDVVNDIKNWRRSVRVGADWRISVRWKIWFYVLQKWTGIVVTMYI